MLSFSCESLDVVIFVMLFVEFTVLSSNLEHSELRCLILHVERPANVHWHNVFLILLVCSLNGLNITILLGFY